MGADRWRWHASTCPRQGPASISRVQLPSPSVVVGDTMRDSAGRLRRSAVTAFSAEGAPIPSMPQQLFVLDTARAHSSVGQRSIGDELGNGHGGRAIDAVFRRPRSMCPSLSRRRRSLLGAKPDTLRAPLGPDYGDLETWTLDAIAVTYGRRRTTCMGFIVKYRIHKDARARSRRRLPAVYLSDAAESRSKVDTTDAQRNANHRQVTVVTRLLPTRR